MYAQIQTKRLFLELSRYFSADFAELIAEKLDATHISIVNEDTFVKFGTLIDIGDARATIAKFLTFGKIQHNGGLHILVKFGTLIDISYAMVTVAQYLTFGKAQY